MISHYVLDVEFYDQIDCVARGSPLGPVMAIIFMCHFEVKWITQNNARHTIWFRHVDDISTLFKIKDSTIQLLQFLIDCHNNIKFIIKIEENDQIRFLHILPKRTSQHQFSTSFYRMNTFTPSRIHSLIVNTISVFFTLSLFVVYRICSSPLSLQSSPSNLRKFLLQNGYPVGIINYNINYVLRIQQRKAELPRTVPKKTVCKVLPYLGVQSELITTQL